MILKMSFTVNEKTIYILGNSPGTKKSEALAPV